MHLLPTFLALVAFFSCALGKPTGQKAAQGITFVESEALLTFDYSVGQANSRNWIGLYHASGGGPDDQQHHDNSLTWAYTPLNEGRVRLAVPELAPGRYKAYFLAADGYKWLADPIELSLNDYGGSLSLQSGSQTPFVFSFNTNQPNSKNWVGIWYANGGGPANQQRRSSPANWAYTSGDSSGTVSINTRGLPPGKYVAYFLANDGYSWLANPIDFYIPGNPSSLSFLVDSFTTLRATQNVAFVADVSGLLATAPDGGTTFSKVSGDGWIDVSPTGLVSGTPPSGADRVSAVTVRATASNGATAQLEVKVPIQQEANQVTVLSFNLWIGGTNVNNYHQKQIQHILSRDIDLVGLQESGPTHSHRLAQALGWYAVHGGDTSILSRYPITQTLQQTDRWTAVRIALDHKGHEIVHWNAHLGYTPYGPYDFCYSHLSQQQVMENEAQSGRTPQIKQIVSLMSDSLNNAGNVPVLLTGDFNSPSHQDWTQQINRCGAGYVPWPSTKVPTDAGLIDSYRRVHPDPASDPGVTWSPIYLTNGDYGNQPEPLDRIDFIFFKGDGLNPIRSEALLEGNPTPENHHQNNQWPTDHKSVRTIFQLSK